MGRYLVLRPLGRGGMGTVYAAHDPELDRTVALKIVRRRGSSGERLKEEAQTLARLSHPNVVAVHDVGDLPDGVFIAMAFVEGMTLRKWSEANRTDPAALSAVMREAGRGLAAAHAAGLVHLDFKPDNVMIADDGRVLVLDFGLAQSQDRTGGGTEVAPAGTPAYMAPEQHRLEALDARADQFAFCATWLECAVGYKVFPGDSPTAITRAILEGETLLPTRPSGIDRNVWSALLRGISPEASARWPDMQTLLAQTEPPRRLRWQTVAAVVVAGSLGAGAMWAIAGNEVQCKGAASKVAEAWSKTDADALLGRVSTSSAGIAAKRASSIVAGLDTYAAGLGEAYIEACRVAPDNTPRRVCLDGRLEQLRASRDLALDGESEELERIFDSLQDVQYCRRADEDALYREVSDPQRAQAVLRKLAQAQVWVKAGRQDASAPELQAVVDEAAALGWSGVESLARTDLAGLAADAGDTAAADHQFELALDLAARAGSDVATSKALRQRIQVYALNGDGKAVRVLAPSVRAAARRAGETGATVTLALGNVHQLTGDYDAAEAAYTEAMELADVPHLQLRAQSNLGALELYRGKYRLAQSRFETLVQALTELRGESSVARLKALANLADAEHLLGDEEAALGHYAEALQWYREGGGASTRPAEHLKLNYSIALLESGAVQRAAEIGVPAAQRVLELHGEKHVFSISARDFLNALARSRGQHEEALASTQRLMTDLEALFGTGNPVQGFLCLAAAESALHLDLTDVGLNLLQTAEPLLVSLNPAHPFLVVLYRLRAELELQAGDLEASLASSTEAVRRASGDSVHPVERGRAHLAFAKARMARGDTQTEIQPDLERAAGAFAAQPKNQASRVDEVAALLADGA